MKSLYCILICLIGVISVCKAQTQVTAKSNYHALLIAIDTYSSSTWSDLKNPVRDADVLKKTLKSKYDFLNIHTLYNKQATRKNVIETLDNLINDLSENDNLVVFYSGHGFLLGEEGYWVPSEARTKERYEMISTNEIKNIVSKAKSKHILMLVDACFSSTIFKSSDFFADSNISNDYYNKVDALLSRQAITAGGLKPVADGHGQHSIFAQYLIQFLDKNHQPDLSASELFDLIKFPITANTSNTPEFGHLQNTGHEGGQFIFQLQQEKICEFDVYINEGEFVKFTQEGGTLKAITNKKTARYRWTYNNTILDNTKAELKVTQSGTYSVTAIEVGGACSDVAIASVNIVLPEVNLSIQEGDNISFTYKGKLNAIFSGYDGEVNFEWQRDRFLIGKTQQIVVMTSGVYTIIARLPDGKILASAKTIVTIKDRIYTVKLGDDIRRIARKFFGESDYAERIYEANPTLKQNTVLKVGTQLIIPSKESKKVEKTYFTLGANKDFIPFSSSDLYKGGMLTDIMSTIMKTMEQPVELKYIPNNLITANTYYGQATIAFPFARKQNGEVVFHYSDPLYNVLYVFFKHKDNPIVDINKPIINRKKNKNHKKVIVATTPAYQTDALQKYVVEQAISIRKFNSLEACFKALKAGEVDLVATLQIAGFTTLQQNQNLQLNEFEVLKKEIDATALHAVISKKHPNAITLMKQFNETLKTLQEEGIINKIIDTHLDLIQKAP